MSDLAEIHPDPERGAPEREAEQGGESASQPGVPLLQVTHLHIELPTEAGLVQAVRGVSLSLQAGETVGIVGESGSGKTMLSLAMLGLLPQAAVVRGSVRLHGQELVGAKNRDWRQVRGAKVAMIFQDPMTALNPMYSVGWQVAECVRLHQRVDGRQAARRAVELLDTVGLPQPEQLARRYPHELSGGMRQRVMIAIAIANNPDLLIADEPTTALDVTVQAQILDTLRALRQQSGAAMVLISHDLGVVAGVADRLLVMYAGKAVEVGGVSEVFAAPRMPYTAGLLASVPTMDGPRARLASIPGTPPTGMHYGPGCAFAPRCPAVMSACVTTEPELVPVGPGHWAACLLNTPAGGAGSVAPAALRAAFRDDFAKPAPVEGQQLPGAGALAGASAGNSEAGDDAGSSDVVLSARNLTKRFRVRGPGWRSHSVLEAVTGVDLDLRRGRSLGLVGESGCGKSTLARLLVRLEEPTAGSITLRGRDLTKLDDNELREVRRDIQMVFQDPYSSLNPRLSVGEIVGEPLTVHHIPGRTELVRELLQSVGLDPSVSVRFPSEFSGGQRQRIGIARALALQPEVLVLDEPVSALDVSVQASVINLLRDLQDSRHVAYLFIAHDLAVVRQVADEIAVMYLGSIVEQGPADGVYRRPAHPYTTALLSAVPVPDPARERARTRILLQGEVPSPVDPPSGCRFRTRCWKADERCVIERPPLRLLEGQRLVACHYPENGPWAGTSLTEPS